MRRPKRINYVCGNDGCLEEPVCHACEMAKLWQYIDFLEEVMKKEREKKSPCPLCQGKGTMPKADESKDMFISGDDL